MTEEYLNSIMAPYSFKMPPPAEMKVIVEVLELFKRLPCLWDQAHHLFHAKEERNRAYKILIEKFKIINPAATKDIIKKKLDNMRNAYRREYKKVLAARAAGQAEHIPVLWYYHHLTFLDENKEDSGSTSTVDETTENFIKLEEDEVIIENYDSYYEGTESVEENQQLHKLPPQKKIKLTCEEPLDAEVTQSRQDEPEDSNHSLIRKSEVNDRLSETFGRTIGLQLRELEPMQRYIAEKLISDVIFYGRLRKLNTETRINNNKL